MKRQKGFTLIELMIVVAIIAILAALIVPNLMQNRIQANETSALGALRTYASAQSTFQRGKFSQYTDSGLPAGAYADDFSNLYYVAVEADGAPIQLINKTFADARTVAGGGSDLAVTGSVTKPTTFTPYQGYSYNEDPNCGDATNTNWNNAFALIAYPNAWAVTGYNSFWIGPQGVILQQNITATSGETPTAPAAAATPWPNGQHADWIIAG